VGLVVGACACWLVWVLLQASVAYTHRIVASVPSADAIANEHSVGLMSGAEARHKSLIEKLKARVKLDARCVP